MQHGQLRGKWCSSPRSCRAMTQQMILNQNLSQMCLLLPTLPAPEPPISAVRSPGAA